MRTFSSANINTKHDLVLCKYRISMQLKKNRSVELKSKINVESLENRSTRLLFQNRFLKRINGNSIEEGDKVDQV